MAHLFQILLSLSPIGVLLALMLWRKWGGQQAAAAAWFCAIILAVLFFGGDPVGLAIANSKGLALALFIVLIIWSSVFLYNIVAASGGMAAISRRFSTLTGSPVGQSLLLGWVFSGFLQGVAGFGVPVAVTAPLLAAQGVPPVSAVAATLIGHSWSVTFGSMGSSFFTLQLVTGLPAAPLAHWTAVILLIPILLTGFGVCAVVGGRRGVREGLWPVLATGSVMAGVQWLAATGGMPQAASFVAGVAGMAVMAFVLRHRSIGCREDAPCPEQHDAHHFWTAFSPYIFLIALMLALQLPAVKELAARLRMGWSYPVHETIAGHLVPPEKMYGAISLISHPAPILLAASVFAIVAYSFRHVRPSLRRCLSVTARQCIPTTITTALLLMMAMTMNDVGMTSALATGIAALSGKAFPFLSGFIGALGCFLTGSNTSSNVLFGTLQVQAAKAAEASPLIVAAGQTAGGSLGSAIAPAKVILGTTTLSLSEEEPAVFRLALRQTLIILLALGLLTVGTAYLWS